MSRTLVIEHDPDDGSTIIDNSDGHWSGHELLEALAEIVAACVHSAEEVYKSAGFDGVAAGQAVINRAGQIINGDERPSISNGSIRVKVKG